VMNKMGRGNKRDQVLVKLLKDSFVVFIKIPRQASSEFNLGNLKCNNPKKLTTGSQFYL